MTAGDKGPTPQPAQDEIKNGENGQDRVTAPEADAGHVKAAPLIKAFGGIRPMASKLGVPVSTVQGWKQRDAVPASRIAEIEAAAKANDIALEPHDTAETPGQAPAAAAVESRSKDDVRLTGSVPASPPSQAEQRQGGGFAGFVAVAALLVSLAAGGGVLWLSQVQRPSTPLETVLAERVGVVEDRVGSVAELADRVAALETAASGSTGLADRLSALESALATAETALRADIETALSEVETSRGGDAPRSAGLPAEQLQALSARVEALEQLPEQNEPQRLSGLETMLNDLAETQSVLVGQLADAPGADALAETQGRIAALEARGAELARLGAALDDVEARLTAIAAADVVEPRALALVLALRQLRSAVLAGQRFTSELELAQRLVGSSGPLVAPLATLQDAAPGGLATARELTDVFPAVARAMLQASLSADAAASAVDRFRARIANVVSVRRTDAGGDDDTGIDAALARAEAALAVDDMNGVLQAMAPYEASAPPEATAWLVEIKQRAAADAAIAQVDAAAFDILSRAEQE